MGILQEMIEGPYAGIIILAAGIFISLFAGFSTNSKVNISMAAINAVAFAASIYIYIRNYMIMGPVSGPLIELGLSGFIMSIIIIFCGLNILFFISIERLSRKSFVREIILLSFSIISVLFLIMSDSIVIFTVSIIATILSIFTLLSVSGENSSPAREFVGKSGMKMAIPAALILSGISVLAGTGSMGDLSSYTNMENTGDPLLVIATIIFGSAVYLYFFMYPFQGTFLRLSRRAGAATTSIWWFLYIPSGLVLLIRFEVFFNNYFRQENIYGFIILAVLAFLNLFGAGIGSIKAGSLKRIVSMFILFQLGTILLFRAAGYTGIVSGYIAGLHDLMVLVISIITFLPLSVMAIYLEKNTRDGRIYSASGLLRRRPYLGICIVINFLWWLACGIYAFFIRGPLSSTIFHGKGAGALVLYIGYAAALLLITANIVRIMILFFRRPSGKEDPAISSIPPVFYIYVSFFALLALATAVMVVIGRVGISEDSINIWGNAFYIFGNGN